MLKTRLLFGALMIAALAGILVGDAPFEPYYPFFALATSVIVWIASGEICALLSRLPVNVHPWFVRTGCLTIHACNWLPHVFEPVSAIVPNLASAIYAFVAFGMFSFLLAASEYEGPGKSTTSISGHILAFFYVGVLSAFVVQLRWHGSTPASGAIAFLLGTFVAKCCDIGAYFTGRAFGRTKIAPVLSPGKTVEGSIGGLAAAMGLAFLIVLVGEWATGVRVLSTSGSLGFGLAIGMSAQVGDLMESLIKRDCQQKDASANIPGFGGILDVIDSVLFSGPVGYLLIVGLASS